jgi:hypothetical protein
MRFLRKWLIATLAGAVTFFVWGAFSHLVLLKGVGFNRVADEARIVPRSAPLCLAMVCISCQVSTSGETHPQKRRPLGKQDSARARLE